MSQAENTPRPGPGQPFPGERRSRAGCLGKLLSLLAFGFLSLLLFMCLITALVLRPSGVLPQRLSESYVAGSIQAINGPKIAIVQVDGIILDTEVDFVLKQVRQARDDDQVRAVVLRVDSPGGTVSGSDRIWREVATLKEAKKPIVVSMGGMAASGGYYVSAPADYIFAEPTTMTGSIGVILQLPQLHGLMERYGVEVATITSGEWKDAGSMFKDLTPAQRDRWQQVINETHQRFVRVVAQGRQLPLQAAQDLANGKVYSTEEALKLKLIDAPGYQDDAIRKAQNLINEATVRVIRYSKPLAINEYLGLTAPTHGLSVNSEDLLRLQVPRLLLIAQ